MNFSRKLTLLFLSTIYMLSLILRYPDIDGPHDSDSFYIQWLTLKITKMGYNPWILHPLSYVGMYPLSYPFGSQTYISTLSIITNLNPDITIYVIAQFHCLLGIFSTFILTRSVFKNNLITIISTLIFSTSYYFINYTFWTISTRGAIIAIIPLIFYFLFKILESNTTIKYSLLLIINYLLALTLHRSSVYLIMVIIMPFVSIKILAYIIKKTNYRKIEKPILSNYIIILLLIIPLLISINFPDFFENFGIVINKTWINNKFSIFFIGPILNVGYRIISNNLLMILAVIGSIYICTKTNRKKIDMNILIVLFFSLPFIVDYEYFFPIILPFLSMIGGYGLFSYINRIESKKKLSILVIIIITSSTYTLYIQELNTGKDTSNYSSTNVHGVGLSQETRNNALWIENNIPKRTMVIDNFFHTTHSSLVEMRTLRQMDLITTSQSYQDSIVFDQLSINEVVFNQKEKYYGGKITSLSGSKDVYEYSILFAIFNKEDKSDINIGYIQLLSKFEVKYILETSQGQKWWMDIHSLSIEKGDTPPFFNDLYINNYQIYSNELVNIYFFKNNY